MNGIFFFFWINFTSPSHPEDGVITSPEVEKVMLQVDRAHYVKRDPYQDCPQSIGKYSTQHSSQDQRTLSLSLLIVPLRAIIQTLALSLCPFWMSHRRLWRDYIRASYLFVRRHFHSFVLLLDLTRHACVLPGGTQGPPETRKSRPRRRFWLRVLSFDQHDLNFGLSFFFFFFLLHSRLVHICSILCSAFGLMVGPTGRVIGIDRIPQLIDMATKSIPSLFLNRSVLSLDTCFKSA